MCGCHRHAESSRPREGVFAVVGPPVAPSLTVSASVLVPWSVCTKCNNVYEDACVGLTAVHRGASAVRIEVT